MTLKSAGFALILLLSCMAGRSNAQWYGSADFLIMDRFGDENLVLQRQAGQRITRTVEYETTTVTSDTTTTTVRTPILEEVITEDFVGGSVLRADDIDLGLAPGARVLIGRWFGDFGIEGSWLWTDSWSGGASVSDVNGNLVGPFASEGALLNRHIFREHIPSSTIFEEDDPQAALQHLNSSARIEQRSKLRTGDLNLTGRLMESPTSNVTLLTGFRFAELEERFGYQSTGTPVPADYIATVNSPSQSVQTRNRLFGPQIGLAINSAIYNAVILNLSAKTTLAYNEVDRDMAWSPDATNPALNVFSSRSDSKASFLGEFSITGTLCLTTNLSMHAGYQVLVLSDVALAADNFDRNLDASNQGTSLINANSGVAFGSPVFGTTFSF